MENTVINYFIFNVEIKKDRSKVKKKRFTHPVFEGDSRLRLVEKDGDSMESLIQLLLWDINKRYAGQEERKLNLSFELPYDRQIITGGTYTLAERLSHADEMIFDREFAKAYTLAHSGATQSNGTIPLIAFNTHAPKN